MASHVPGEDANLIEVEGQAIFGFGEDSQILRDFLVSILNLIQHENATMRWPSAYCAMSSGTSRSTMRASTQPTRLWESRTSHQSSITGTGSFFVFVFAVLIFIFIVIFIGGLPRGGGAKAPGLSAVPRFSSASFSPEEI